MPLNGSAWAKASPGKLPFENCRLVQNFHTAGTRNAWGVATLSLIYGRESKKDLFRNMAVLCWTEKLGLAFSIPVFLSPLQRAGANAIFAEADIHSKTWLTNLDNKTVGDLFDRYQGCEGGFTAFVGFSYWSVTNRSGIRMREISARAGARHHAGYIVMDLTRGYGK